MSLISDLDALGFEPGDDPTPAELKERWRELALDHHPDRGGDTDAFAELTGSYSRLRARAIAPRRCPTCKGKKKVAAASGRRGGFQTVSTICPECKGQGEVRRS